MVATERQTPQLNVINCVNTRLLQSRGCGVRAAMLMTSLLAGCYVAYVAVMRPGRRRIVVRPVSRDANRHDVTGSVATSVGGDSQLHGSDVDNDVDVAATSVEDMVTANVTCATGDVTNSFLSAMTRRRRRLQQTCNDSENIVGSRDVIGASRIRDVAFARSLLFDTDHGIVYCAVPKVASSSVKTAMALMTGRVDKSRRIDVHDLRYMTRIGLTSLGLQRRLATGRNNTWPRHSKKFIVVRHPLERVVSAYRDKFERINRWNEYFHRKYGKLIVSRYRRGSELYQGAEHSVSFVEFVRFLTDGRLSDSRKFNPHWAPVSDLCRPCRVHYDYIIKLEQFDTEAVQLWKDLYGDYGYKAPVLPTLIHRNTRIERTSCDVTKRYLQQLTRQQARQLSRLYADDFRLFAFSPNIYDS